MRIALFTETFLPKIDGVVTRVVRTLEAFNELGHEALVLTGGHPPAVVAGVRCLGTHSVAFPVYPEARMALPTRGLTAELDRFAPDVIHGVNPVWIGAWGLRYAHKRNLPTLASFHTDLPKYAREMGFGAFEPIVQRVIRSTHGRADVNLATSMQMVHRGQELGMPNVHLWPKAVDTVAFRPEAFSPEVRAELTEGRDGALLLYVGRLSKEKNLEDLRPMMDSLPQVNLAFVGSGPARDDLERLFAGTRTYFAGYRSGEELSAAFASADLFVFPSTTETLGFVALESMASGVPVVGANAGGIPFAVEDGVTGLLFPPRDSRALTDCVRELLENRPLRETMGRTAREEAQKHSWLDATQVLVKFYQEAIDRQRRAGDSTVE